MQNSLGSVLSEATSSKSGLIEVFRSSFIRNEYVQITDHNRRTLNRQRPNQLLNAESKFLLPFAKTSTFE